MTLVVPPPLTNPGATPLTLEQRATKAGKAAFERGAKRIPCHDREMMSIIKDVSAALNLIHLTSDSHERRMAGLKQTNHLLDLWLKAWDEANLAAPVP